MSQVYKGNRESLNKRLLTESYFMRNLLGLSAIIALGNLKPNINWHSVTVWISLVLMSNGNELGELHIEGQRH